MNTQPLLTEARRLLNENPRDDIHDLSHHERVWQNARRISKSLNQSANLEVLEVATMWHDVMISKESLSLGSEGLLQETISYLSDFMKSGPYDQEFHDSVISAIEHHNFFTKYQMTLEGKILYDADKLDVLNPIRYKRIIAGIKNRKISNIQVFLIAKAAKVWLKTMRSRYHFELSKQLHDTLIEDLVRDKVAIEFAKKYGVDIVGLVKK